MSEKVTGNKQQDLAALKAYYESLRAAKQEKKQVEEAKDTQVRPETKELGAKLLDQPYAKINFVSTQASVTKQDADDLSQLFAMAGIKTQMPTKAVYERIGASVGQVSKAITDLETEDHIEQLFNSPEFKVLDNIFLA